MSAISGIVDTYTLGVSGTDGARINGSSTEAGATQHNIDATISAGSTNQSVSIAWTVANTKGVFILASQNCTLKTNSTSSPDNTINLIGGVPLIWRASAGYYANPFTVDVTVWYITCTPATRLQASILTT